ncbi:hypothetical protein BJ994_000436 [Arthrobacter pigmenti]|uniref:Uncharacterized protein n=1 Tax=Arthrobacter pigmenti TaxID=271432 RepID=A0A846RI37_9MICC|nr:hypothetical protein [Arthrobacter pigmenti]NJC21360.1 hypothetical protein [Arthrobacter pigmenti]
MAAQENPETVNDDISQADEEATVNDVAEDVRAEIRLGHVEDDVAHVLEERLDEAGVHLRPEKVDDMADEIENDVSS